MIKKGVFTLSFIINQAWYRADPLLWMLLPLSFVYQLISFWRRLYLKTWRQKTFPVPVIVVGNLTVGGTGKTPVIIALAQAFKQRNLNVGIVSRGYGATMRTFPYEVKHTDSPLQVGDEPLLLARKTGCPVVIAPRRVQAVEYLLHKYKNEIILCDDGLQHYALDRAIEIAVIDGVRGLGNGFCLPAGPLREEKKRLNTVDFIVVNGGCWERGYRMDLTSAPFVSLLTGKPGIPKEPAVAVAGIGNPERFFSTLRRLNFKFTPCAFPDHHKFSPNDLNFMEKTVVMTEKDAVKCRAFATENMYYLPVEATLSQDFWEALWSHERLKSFC